MKRSILNSVFYTLLYNAAPLQILSFFSKQWSLWFFLSFPILFFFVKSQNYLYKKDGLLYFRRTPFFRGVPLNHIKNMGDLRLIDRTINIRRLWLYIEQIRR
jgi:hypothetical protein